MSSIGLVLFVIAILALIAGFIMLLAAIFEKSMLKSAGYVLLVGAVMLLLSFAFCSVHA
jgi:hypothetical protein